MTVHPPTGTEHPVSQCPTGTDTGRTDPPATHGPSGLKRAPLSPQQINRLAATVAAGMTVALAVAFSAGDAQAAADPVPAVEQVVVSVQGGEVAPIEAPSRPGDSGAAGGIRGGEVRPIASDDAWVAGQIIRGISPHTNTDGPVGNNRKFNTKEG